MKLPAWAPGRRKLKGPDNHIVAGELLIEEEQVKTLAERIIEDITIEDSSLEEVELFFYHNKSLSCQPEAADAYARWVAGEFSVKTREGDIDFLDQSTW